MPVNRGTIDGQLREIGEGERWWEQREFRDLPHILHSDERIHGLINGRLLGPRRPRLMPTAPWLIVATSQRLICLRQERFGRKQVDIRLDQVIGMQHGSNLRAYQIRLETRLDRYRIRISKADAFRFLGVLTPLIPQPPVPPPGTGMTLGLRLPDMGALAVLPGLAGLASRVSRLPASDQVRRADLARVEANVERLEGEVERLQQQVEFLERLLQQRTEGVYSLPGSTTDR